MIFSKKLCGYFSFLTIVPGLKKFFNFVSFNKLKEQKRRA